MNGGRNMLKKIKNKKLRFIVVSVLLLVVVLNLYSGIDSIISLLKVNDELFSLYFFMGLSLGWIIGLFYPEIKQRWFD